MFHQPIEMRAPHQPASAAPAHVTFADALRQYHNLAAARDAARATGDEDAGDEAEYLVGEAYNKMLAAPAGSVSDAISKLEAIRQEYSGGDVAVSHLAPVLADLKGLCEPSAQAA